NGRRWSVRGLDHFQYLVSRDVLQRLNNSRWPVNFNQVSTAFGAQSKMYWAVARGRIPDAGGHVVVLRAALGYNLDTSADAVAIALCSLQSNIERVARL